MDKLRQWFTACRGYSLPTSFLCFLTAFSYGFKHHGNLLYGILAFVGIIFVHLGVNLYDDYIDTIFKTPKQGCKTEYLDKNIFTLKQVLIGFILYFTIALLIGGFFIYKLGFEIFYAVIPTAIIALLYPRAGRYLPCEFFISLVFGPLMFEGVYFVMTKSFDIKILLISIPLGLLVGVVGMVHSYMDMDFDKNSGKKTYPLLFKTKKSALSGIISIIVLSYILITFLVFNGTLSYTALLSLGSIYFMGKLKDNLKSYNQNEDRNDFLRNFLLCQKLFIFVTAAVILSIIG